VRHGRHRAGEVKAYQFYPAVMHSAARLTYNEVAAILGNTKGPEAERRPAIVPHLLNLNDVFRALLQARQARGAIDFETTETYIVCNAMGKIEKIIPRTRNDAHRLIEECMLAANVCAADFLIRHDQPSTFRIHAVPTEEKLNQLRTFLKQVGLNLGGGTSRGARLRRADAADQGASGRDPAADHAAAFDAAGGLQPGQRRPLRPGLRGTTPTSPARSAAIRTC
jgi:ribonuclease R